MPIGDSSQRKAAAANSDGLPLTTEIDREDAKREQAAEQMRGDEGLMTRGRQRRRRERESCTSEPK